PRHEEHPQEPPTMKTVRSALLGLCLGISTHAAEPGPELVVKQDRERILKLAEAALSMKPTGIARIPSPLDPGRPDEFFSMSDYYWPDPSQPDGKPYIMRD